MINDIVIIGAGGFGREVAWLIEEINKNEPQWNLLGFIDDGLESDRMINGYPIIGNIDWLISQNLSVVVAVGDPITKKKIIDRLLESKNQYPILIHPSVISSKRVSIGEGTIICAGSILTVNISIGKHVIINLDVTVGHDVIIGDYSTILPSANISGAVNIDNCVSVGTGSAIIQGVHIGENTVVGAGAVVVKNLPSNCTAVGMPAKPIKIND